MLVEWLEALSIFVKSLKYKYNQEPMLKRAHSWMLIVVLSSCSFYLIRSLIFKGSSLVANS